MTNDRKQPVGAQKVLWPALCNWWDRFLGPKGSIGKDISKNSCFHCDKSIWTAFSGNIERDKSQGAIYKRPQGFSDKYWGSKKINSLGPGSCWKHKLLKRGNISSEEKFDRLFLVVSNMTNVSEQNIGVQKVFWHVLCKQNHHFFRT